METPNPEPIPAPSPSLGLPIASLVLGILAIVLSFLLLGGVLGLVGLGLGIICLRRKQRPAGMARWGMALSVIGVIASLGFAILYYSTYQKLVKLADSPSESEADFTKWEGVMAPEISIATLDGRTVKLSDLKGKRVILDFWATWCPPCRKEIPHFIQLTGQTSRDNLVIVGISSEDAETLKAFVKKEGINYPIGSALNPSAPYAQIPSIPTTFFIDRHGVIQKLWLDITNTMSLKVTPWRQMFPGNPSFLRSSRPAFLMRM